MLLIEPDFRPDPVWSAGHTHEGCGRGQLDLDVTPPPLNFFKARHVVHVQDVDY